MYDFEPTIKLFNIFNAYSAWENGRTLYIIETNESIEFNFYALLSKGGGEYEKFFNSHILAFSFMYTIPFRIGRYFYSFDMLYTDYCCE